MKSLWIIFIILTIKISAWAHVPKVGNILGTFGPMVHMTHASRTQDYENNQPSMGVGVLVEGDPDKHGGLELGLFYMKKTYVRGFGAEHIAEKVNRIAIPVGYRYWINDRISVGLFFNALFGNGDWQWVASGPNASAVTIARQSAEYGLEYSAQYEIWRDEKFTTLIDGRYFSSFSSASNEDAHHFGLMVGFKYAIQEK